MSATGSGDCQDQAEHQLHICQLKKKRLAAEVSARTGHPAYICHNCNAVADHAEDLCNPSPFVKRT